MPNRYSRCRSRHRPQPDSDRHVAALNSLEVATKLLYVSAVRALIASPAFGGRLVSR
jgi:hypothetical protein